MTPQPEYVDIFPFARTDDGLRLLLLRRHAENSFPGIWQPAAGKVKAGETRWQAALREVQEETGHSPTNFYALAHVSVYYLHHEDRILQVPAFLAEIPFKDPILTHEHDAFCWCEHQESVTTVSWEPYRQALSAIPDFLASAPALAAAQIPLNL